MWLVIIAGVTVLVTALGVLAWVHFHRVNTARLTRVEEEAEAAEHSRPLANVTVLRPPGRGE